MMHGRPPVAHFWPLNHCLATVDISDPHVFLQIKRGILQYAWVKPLLAIATIGCKATGTFREGIIDVNSGYFWTGLIYNVSICWSLYDLALFWVCMSDDMQPFRPMPKFLCIKGIIFASWWQGFFLSILVWLSAIPNIGGGYTADNLAAAIQDALICFEMPLFALSHWYAFSWTDYADRTISDARMPIRFALRDAFGIRDLIEDAKETFSGKKYEYRYFDAEDNVIGHEESVSRIRRMQEGMRYERNGRGKYWVPQAGGRDAQQSLLGGLGVSQARTMSPGDHGNLSRSSSQTKSKNYGTNAPPDNPEEPEMDAEEEQLYTRARALEYGDWNYPVINTHYATREDQLRSDPNIISQSSNRALMQPTKDNRIRRKSRINSIRKDAHQYGRTSSSSSEHPHGSSSSGEGSSKGQGRSKTVQAVRNLLRNASSDSGNSRNSQLVDLVVEDHQEEEIARVRARKEGGPGWNSVEQKHFVITDPDENESEDVRHGFNPDQPEQEITDETHTLNEPSASGRNQDGMQNIADVEGQDQLGHQQPWEQRHYSNDPQPGDLLASPMFEEERNAWGDGGKNGDESK